jgi:SsrA-binding protein
LRHVANERYDSTSVKSNSKKGDWEGVKIVAQNRAASYNYTLLDKLEAGLILVGTEVKSLREGKGTLREAYAEIRLGEGWLVNWHIPEYLPGGLRNHDPLRKRKLLLNRRELDRLTIQTQQKGLTVVPLKIYFRDGIAKCELAVAKGKNAKKKPNAKPMRRCTAPGADNCPKTKGRHADSTGVPAVRLD